MKMGFTLFELVLVLGLVSVLMMLVIPSYNHLISRAKTRSAVNRILDAIHFAQFNAITKNQVILFCGSKDQQHCDGNWSAGQLLMMDASGQILHNYSALPEHDQLWWNSSLGYHDALKLSPSGFTLGQRGSFYYCPQHNPEKYGAIITIIDSGRARIITDPEQLIEGCHSSLNKV